MVFLEGVYGLLVLVPLTIGFQYVSCPWESASACVNVDGQLYLENIGLYWSQVTTSPFLLLLSLGLVVSIAISVPIAVTVSKLISPVSRSLADVCRTVLIWLFGVVVTLTLGVDQPEYRDMEDTRLGVNLLKGGCFLILILGTLLYHDLLPLPCKKQIEER